MMILYLGISTLVTGIVYLIFGNLIKGVFANPMVTAILLSATGLILWASDMQKKNEIPISGMGFLRGIIIGIGQGIAMLPGISRSGTTIATSLFCGLKRSEAARFSFLLSIPAILLANITEIDAISGLTKYQMLSYVFGALAAFVSGYLVIGFLIRLIQAAKLKYFAFYCWFISILSIVLIISSH
jgi:undecaprenyl-diphosphatase